MQKASMHVPMYVLYILIEWLHFHLISLQSYQDNISAKIGLILSFSLVLIWGARLPVVRKIMDYTNSIYSDMISRYESVVLPVNTRNPEAVVRKQSAIAKF